jgi:acetyl esterase/lipase
MFVALVGGGIDERPKEIDLWPNGVPHAPANPGPESVTVRQEEKATDRHVRNVHRPTLTVYRPAAGAKNRQAAVVICPGGGYHILALDKEGHDVARWFASVGVVGCVLKYRLPRPDGHVYPAYAPLSDAQRALRYVRAHAKELDVRSDRVGILGFSAGGHLASTAATHHRPGNPAADDPLDRQPTRPDFAVLIYAVTTFDPAVGHAGSAKSLLGANATPAQIGEYCNDKLVDKNTPPTFLMHTDDDPVKVENSIAFYLALRKAKVPAEMHIFAKGGHGYGMRTTWQGETDPPVSKWPMLCEQWLTRTVWKEKP